MTDENFEKWLNGPYCNMDMLAKRELENPLRECWTAALASRSTTPGKLEELIDGLVGKLCECFRCRGTGKPIRHGDKVCPDCLGSGNVPPNKDSILAALKPALREAVDAEVSAAYAKGASDMREAAADRIDSFQPDQYNDVPTGHAIRAIPIPAAPQPRDLGKLWELQKRWDAKFKTIDGDMLYGFCADELADILEELEESR